MRGFVAVGDMTAGLTILVMMLDFPSDWCPHAALATDTRLIPEAAKLNLSYV